MAQAITAYDYITQNNRKTWMLVLLFPISLLILVWIACYCTIICVDDKDFIQLGTSFLPNLLQSTEPSSINGALGFTLAFAIPTLSHLLFGCVLLIFLVIK